MSREQWKDFLETIGFIAIIASLIFLGIETRNSTRQSVLNTQALEIAAYQDLMDNIADINAITLQDPGVAALMYKATRTTEALKDLGNQNNREFWESTQQNFVEPYRNYVNRLIEE